MNRKTWRFWAAGLGALLAVAGVVTGANAAFPAVPPSVAPTAGAPAPRAPANTSDPYVENFNCSQITARGIDKQMNIRASLIMAKCGQLKSATSPAVPPAAIGGSALGRVHPNAYGGVDVDTIPPDGTYPHVTQSESIVWGHGSTIVVNYNDSRTAPTCYGGLAYSTDGGATFQHHGQPLCTAHGTNYGDPIVVFDVAHNHWVAGDLATGCGGQGIGLWTSPDGITWTVGACAVNAPLGDGDRESMYVDNNPASPHYGMMFISYVNYANPGPPISVVRSTDGGATWSTPINLALPGGVSFLRNVQDTGGPNGTFFIAAMNENGGGLNPRSNYMYRSTNGGLTWSSAILVTAPFPAPGVSTSGYFALFFPTIWRYEGWGQPGAGPGGIVHYAFTKHGAGSDPGDVYYTRSADDGLTWSPPIKMNTDVTTNGNWQPSLAVTMGGAVLVSWYDGRNGASASCGSPGSATPCYARWGRVSLDNGATWLPDMAISDVISPLPAQPDSSVQAVYEGDYDYSSADGTTAYTTWNDGRNAISGTAQQDVYFDKVSLLQGTPTPTVTRTPPATPTRLATATPPTGTLTPCTSSFSDVHPADYFYTPVLYLACHGVVSGYNDGTFRPYANTTRSQMVKIVVLGFQKPITTPLLGGYTCTDVLPSFPFFSVIETAAALNIVSGYTCGGPGEPCDSLHRPYFRPYAPVTRGQLSKIDVVAAGWAVLNPANRTFEDVLPATAFYAFVETAACHAVISGYNCGGPGEPCGTPPRPFFRQNAHATRGQIAKIVYLSITAGGGCVSNPTN